MEFNSQSNALSQLSILAAHNTHSILIDGVSGSGKTYIATKYADFLDISDVHIINSNVNDIREYFETSIMLTNKILFIIENADLGVVSVFSTMLKFLEEPVNHVYVIVTCRNIQYVPDTIISRCSVVSIMPPTFADINTYAKAKDSARFNDLSHMKLWKVLKSFSDVDYIYSLNNENLNYIENTSIEWLKKLPVSNSMWRLNHFADNSTFPPEYKVRMIMNDSKNQYVKNICLECLNDLQRTNIAGHVALAKFALDIKYLCGDLI